MAQQLQNITVQAPGFGGINTQDSPIGLDSSYASVADNCVIDQYGRVGARKGHEKLTTTNSSLLAGNPIRSMIEFCKRDGTKEVFSSANNKVFKGDTTLTELPYTGSSGLSSYCHRRVEHFTGTETASYVYLTVENIGNGQIQVTVMPYPEGSSNEVDDLVIPQTTPAYTSISAISVLDGGGMRRVINYDISGGEPDYIQMNVLWSKDDFAGNWMLGDTNTYFGFSDTCTPIISGSNWKMVSFNDDVYLFQRNHPALKIDGSDYSIADVGGSAPEANEAVAAYGRLWATDLVDNKHTVYWSDTLIGNVWHTGTSGSLDLTTVFPSGADETIALAAHNGFLIIFCRNSIIIYEGAESPATMKLHDTIQGVGCIARDSVQHTGNDIIFLSDDGLRSFGRVLQEKSMPMRDLSKNVRNDLMGYVASETSPIKSLYSPEEAFYLLVLPDNNLTYCFDMRTQLSDGSNRVTTWTGITPTALTRKQDGTIYLGKSDGIHKYSGYTDDGASYPMRYFSNPMDFGSSSNLKFLKKFNLTVIGNVTAQTTLNWAYDYNTNYTKQAFTTDNADTVVAEYGIARYGLEEDLAEPETEEYIESVYSKGIDIQLPTVNGNGSGSVVTVGVESTINGSPYSIQKLDIHALIGRFI